ncbi:MAG: uncharacterized protein A8A55_0680 [Amphiamblys sp. WSBS2006]|nr:MAG: uncharacterized protein A8A55_0680 [Amphiamblys sp. WSBS2006]
MDRNEEFKVYVGGLLWEITSQDLGQMFDKFGALKDAFVVSDRESGRSRGFGFVTFETREAMDRAVREMDGTESGGRQLRVNVATPKTFDR